jgi:hypothetical protein
VTWQILLGTEEQARAHNIVDALDAFERLVRFEVARRAPFWTFVHAGVVGWQQRAILMPGDSFAGKSSLVHALVRAGATYYSDEYAVLDQRGRVYPFAQPLTIRRASGASLRVNARELGAAPGVRPLPVGLVVSTRYVPGATWHPAFVPRGEGLLALLQRTVRAQAAPARAMRVLARVAESAVTLVGPRGDAERTAHDLLRRAAAWQAASLEEIA